MPTYDFDVAVIGGGIAGMSTAARLQATGKSTVVLEQHDHVGGCAGYYREGEFAFDVGATTLVDFGPGGVGGQFLNQIGFDPPSIEIQDAYQLWLPDRTVTLYRDQSQWERERRETFGDDEDHRQFYHFLDQLSETLWQLTRADVKLPIQSFGDLYRNARAVGVRDAFLLRYLGWTVEDALRKFGVYNDVALRRAIAMLVEDTVHATIDDAPLLNAVLGMSIRRVGLGRAEGGMYGFWSAFREHYEMMGGTVKTNHHVSAVRGSNGSFHLMTHEYGEFRADQVVSTVPVTLTVQIASEVVGNRLDDYVEMVRTHEGGAVVVFLGVPEHEVGGHEISHHQILASYGEPLGDGNNMFVSVSAPGDDVSAPEGYRAVILSTHTDLEQWLGLEETAYERRKHEIGRRLVENAQMVYPELGTNSRVCEVGTPMTYKQFTDRPRGAIGGYRQTVGNSNQQAIPQDIGVEGFYLAGDTTWPGLGTVACLKGSQIAAEHVLN